MMFIRSLSKSDIQEVTMFIKYRFGAIHNCIADHSQVWYPNKVDNGRSSHCDATSFLHFPRLGML